MYRPLFFLLLCTSISVVAFGQNKPSSGERELEFEKQRFRQEMRALEMQQEKLERLKDEERVMRIEPGESSNYVIASPEGSFYFRTPHSGQSSQLSLSKSFNGESVKNEGSFDVDENVSFINFSIHGKVSEGKIKITVELPGGEELKEMTIDNSADIQFSQVIHPKQGTKKYGGKWTYEIESVKAVGNYRLSLQTK